MGEWEEEDGRDVGASIASGRYQGEYMQVQHRKRCSTGLYGAVLFRAHRQ
jgi:hypothetical protein